jgi:hypothetical protein
MDCGVHAIVVFFLRGRLVIDIMAKNVATNQHSRGPQGQSSIKPSNSWKLPSFFSSPMSSPMLAEYLTRREKLINEDRALRKDHVRTNYSPAEQKADEVVRCIRAKEAATVWRTNHDGVPHRYPGMEFLKGMMLATHFALRLTSVYSQRYHFDDGAVQQNSLQSKHSKSSCLPPPT